MILKRIFKVWDDIHLRDSYKKKREHSYKTFTAQNQLKVWFVKIKQRLNKRGIRFFYMKAEGRSFIKKKAEEKVL